jgi:Xaa-Pro aminopeptidase
LVSALPVTEPGYYEDGNFGIRIENVTAVVRAETEFCFGGKPFMTFDNITMVRRAI